jgi:hypothetical protein
MIDVFFNSDFFSFKDCSTTPGTSLFVSRNYFACVGVDFWRLGRINFVHADFAIKFCSMYSNIVRAKFFRASEAFEATFMEPTSTGRKSLGVIDNFFAFWADFRIHIDASTNI